MIDINTKLILVGHGSPREEANRDFISLAERVGARMGSLNVSAAFFSIATPTIEDVVSQAYAEGKRRFVLQPYFLHNGAHITKDIPALLSEIKGKFAEISMLFLPTLEGEPALEDILAMRFSPYSAPPPILHSGKEIEQRSREIINTLLGDRIPNDKIGRELTIRIVHATADPGFAKSIRVKPSVHEMAAKALSEGRPIFCDVQMLASGITKTKSPILCGVGDPDVIELAKKNGTTRAAEAMEKYASHWGGGIVAVGNAPTAIWRLLDLCQRGITPPALVVGLPVGFVGAAESKAALWESPLCCVTNMGPRGGSPAAAAAVNALALAVSRG